MAKVKHRLAHDEWVYLRDASSDLTCYPSVPQYPSGKGVLHIGEHHIVYLQGKHRIVMKAHPHHLRIMIERDEPYFNGDFVLERKKVSDVLNQSGIVTLHICPTSSAVHIPRFCMSYEAFRSAVDQVLDQLL